MNPFFPFPVDFPDSANVSEINQVINTQDASIQTSTFDTYSDSSYSNPQNSFSPGQMVYLKVEAKSNVHTNATILLLNEKQEKIKDISYSNNNGIYTASFKAPEQKETYYIKVEVKGEGVDFVSEKNINVTENSGKDESIVEGVADTKVEVTTSVQGEETPQEVFIENTPIEYKDEEKPKNTLFQFIQNFWQKVLNFFKLE